MKIIGQVRDDYTYTVTTNSSSHDTCLFLVASGTSPKMISFENIHSALPLSVVGVTKVEVKGYIGQIDWLDSHTVTIESSTLIGTHSMYNSFQHYGKLDPWFH